MDCRLTGLAKAAGATYTRYADDLAFSGGQDFRRSASNFSLHASAILMEEGFTVAHRKTRIMRPAVRQQLAGLIVNQRLNVKRNEYDRLKAILTNCIRLGPSGQNREALSFREHIEGKVVYVESIHPVWGRKLRALYEKIDWGR